MSPCVCGTGCKLMAWRCLDCRASGAVPPPDVDLATLACRTRRHAVAIFHDDPHSSVALKRFDEVLATAPIVELPPSRIESEAAERSWLG